MKLGITEQEYKIKIIRESLSKGSPSKFREMCLSIGFTEEDIKKILDAIEKVFRKKIPPSVNSK